MKRKRISIHMKLIFLWCFSIGIIALLGFGVYQTDQNIQEGIISVYARQQDEAVERVVRHMKEAYDKNTSPQKNASSMFLTYIQEEPSNAGAYWFLYHENEVLFERDAMQTAMQEGKDLYALVEEWNHKGGKQLDNVMSLFQGKINHLYFSKEEQAELESVSAQLLQLENSGYVVGSSISLSQILNMSTYVVQRRFLYAAYAITVGCILILTILYHRSLKNNRRYKRKQDEAYHNYQAQLIRMEQELKERRRQVKDYQLMDSLSLFYNREYFYTLLLNMKRQNLKSLGMITVELANLHSYIDQYGLEFEQETLTQIKDCLERCIIDENIIARVRDNRIVITIISDDYRQMSEECTMLEKALQALELQIPVKVYSMIQMPNESAMDMYRRVDQIISIS